MQFSTVLPQYIYDLILINTLLAKSEKTVLISGLTSWFSQSSPYYIFFFVVFMVIQRESGCIQREAGTADNFFGEHFYGTFRSNKEQFFF